MFFKIVMRAQQRAQFFQHLKKLPPKAKNGEICQTKKTIVGLLKY